MSFDCSRYTCRPRARSPGRAAGRVMRLERVALAAPQRARARARTGSPSSMSAFSTFQQGWPLTLTQWLGQRWSLTAMRLRYACAGGGSRRGRPAAARGDRRAGGRRSTCSRAGSAAPTSRSSRRAFAGAVLGHEVVVRARRTEARARASPAVRRVRALPRRARVDVRAVRRADDRSRRLRRARARGRRRRAAGLRSTMRARRWSSRSRACCAASSACRAAACSSSATASSDGCSARCSSGAATTCSRSTPIPTRAGARPTGRSTRRSSAHAAPVRTRSTRSRRAARCSSSRTPASCPRIVVYRRELTVVGSRSATPAAMRAAAALLPELDVPEPVVLPLDRFAEGLELFTSRRALKVVFTP